MNCLRRQSFLFIAATLTLLPATGFSQNTIFLRSTPLGVLESDDLNSLLVKLNETLSFAAPDAPVHWKSADGKASSTLTVTENYNKNDLVCRRLAIETTMNREATSRRFGFCKVDGVWLADID